MVKVDYNLIGETVLMRTYENDVLSDTSEIKLNDLENEEIKKLLVSCGCAHETILSKEEKEKAHWDEEQRDVVGVSLTQEDLPKEMAIGTNEPTKELIDNMKAKEEINNDEMHPERYGGDSVYECKKVCKAWTKPGEDGYEGWLKNTIIKYCSRFGAKDEKLKEAKKILNYAQFLCEYEEEKSLKDN